MGLTNNIDLNALQGEICNVDELRIIKCEDGIRITLRLFTDKCNATLILHNASDIHIDFTSPLLIEGFEILDNRSRGWQDDVRYTLNDFENSAIKLRFESYEIVYN